MKKFLHNVAARFKRIRQRRTGTEYEVVWDESEVRVQWLTLEKETGSVSFPWDSVSAVDTFKRDLLTVDCICLAFDTPEGWIEVNEETKGWGGLLDAVESSLPGFPSQEQWWRKVMIPAFETNHLRLWTKGQREQKG